MVPVHVQILTNFTYHVLYKPIFNLSRPSLPRRRSYGFVTQSFLSHEVGTRDEPLRTFPWEATPAR